MGYLCESSICIMALVESNSYGQEPKKGSQFRLILSMFRDYFSKKYTDMSRWTLISIGLGLLYFFSPIDIIPDIAIPFIGFIDDAVVLGFVARQIGKELKRYEAWRTTQNI